MIYFAQATDGGPIKIGCSGDVGARLAQLESHYGRPLALLGTMPGGLKRERAIHARFAHLRLGRSEQFRPDAELLAFLGRALIVAANPATVEAMPSKSGVLTIRGSAAWREWVGELADHCRLKAADVIDRALIVYARQEGFTEPAPKR